MSKKAIILMNMGGASDLAEIEVFLKNMFNDPRIIGAPAFVRKNLADFIVATRTPEVEKNYRLIGGGSPLLDISRSIQKKLQSYIDDAKVELIMRYTPPFAKEVLAKLKSEGVEKLYLIPMYPQFSTTTTASSIEDIRAHAKAIGYRPEMVSLLKYYEFEPYLDVVESRIIEALGETDPADVNLIFSAHGLPLNVIKRGDPYQKQLEEEVQKHRSRLEKKGIGFNHIHLAYQSKVGPLKWLTPSLETMLENIKNKRALIYPISFTVDNSETLFELDIEYKEVAEKLKFEYYKVCRCPNDSDDFVRVLELLYRKMG
ncbi:ferrochelatase [Hydrogenimonas sp.]